MAVTFEESKEQEEYKTQQDQANSLEGRFVVDQFYNALPEQKDVA